MKLLVECQRYITYVKVGMFNCFIRVSDYMLVFVMVWESGVRNVEAGYRLVLCIRALGSCLFNKVSFLSYFLTWMPSENCFV